MNLPYSIKDKLLINKLKLEQWLGQLQKIENDLETPVSERLSKIKIIKEEIEKVGQQIDIIKKEIMLLRTKNIN